MTSHSRLMQYLVHSDHKKSTSVILIERTTAGLHPLSAHSKKADWFTSSLKSQSEFDFV